MTPALVDSSSCAKQLNKLRVLSRVKRSRWQLCSNYVLLAPRADSSHVKHAAACRQREHATARTPLRCPRCRRRLRLLALATAATDI